eukprot:NODE_488_length_7780_cov_0.211691.p5 type:complete len:168 gc:universal NODE_488_length_7780_cov_0.211691:701-1204(+)
MAYEIYHCGNIKSANEYIGLFHGTTTISLDFFGICEYIVLGNSKFAVEIPIRKIGIPLVLKIIMLDNCTCKLVSNQKVEELSKLYNIEFNNVVDIKNVFTLCGFPDLDLKTICLLKCPKLLSTLATISNIKSRGNNILLVLYTNSETKSVLQCDFDIYCVRKFVGST